MNIVIRPADKPLGCEYPFNTKVPANRCRKPAMFIVEVRDAEQETESALCAQHGRFAVDTAMNRIQDLERKD